MQTKSLCTVGAGYESCQWPVLHQSIGNIITTSVGSRVMCREQGRLVDAFSADAVQRRLAVASVIVIMRWESRVRVLCAITYSDQTELELEIEICTSTW